MKVIYNDKKLVITLDDLEDYEKREVVRKVKTALKDYLYVDWG